MNEALRPVADNRHDFISEADDLSRRVAVSTAEHQALKTGESYIVVRQSRPRKYLLFSAGDAALSRDDILPFYQLTPEGACIHLGGGWTILDFVERGRAAKAGYDIINAIQRSRRGS